MDLLASAMLAFTFGLSIATFILLCFLWVRQNKLAQENTFLAIRSSDLARELAFLEEVHTSGKVEAIAPEGARERARRTRPLGQEEGGHHSYPH